LAQIYSLDLADGITKEQFVELCPVLIQQQVSNSCVSVPEEVSTDDAVTDAESKSVCFTMLMSAFSNSQSKAKPLFTLTISLF